MLIVPNVTALLFFILPFSILSKVGKASLASGIPEGWMVRKYMFYIIIQFNLFCFVCLFVCLLWASMVVWH